MSDLSSEPSVKLEEQSPPNAGQRAPSSSRKRKKKVEIACVYCRRSHMICDDLRPCQRCIKRGIGHLCYDEPSNNRQRKKAAALRLDGTPILSPPLPESTLMAHTISAPMASLIPSLPESAPMVTGQSASAVMGSPSFPQPPPKRVPNLVLSQTLPYNQEPFFYSEHAGLEFSSLNDFLSMIDDPDLVNGALNDDNGMMNSLFGNGNFDIPQQTNGNNMIPFPVPGSAPGSARPPQQPTFFEETPELKALGALELDLVKAANSHNRNHQPVISDLARDKFFLTAADPTTEISPEERLKQVIKAKLEAGLLQPYNYAKGYARLQAYMDNYMNVLLRQRILKPLLIFRPAFRAIARTLKDVDLVLVEESFERMLLDYDRVFTLMAIPACLWRRTGEIYRGNKEFALLVGVKADDLKDGKLAIYELMSEESAVNFWEKYGAIAFDKGQKAVLTLCNLRTKDGIKRKSCCFSFTIRRDRYNIPSCIVGNFIPIDP